MFGGVVQSRDQARLCKPELKCTELAGKETDDVYDFWWRYQDTVYSVDNTVGSELPFLSYCG